MITDVNPFAPSGRRQPLVLLVDDAPDYLALLGDLLGAEYRVKAVNNGLRAIKVATSIEPPDLILLDLLMPPPDGYEVLRQLKADPRSRDIPVLMMTTMGEPESEAIGFRLGCADYLTKPFNPALVRARVRLHLERFRLLQAERELLEKTVKGALAMLVEMLSLLDPESFGIARRMGGLAERVGRRLGMADFWMLSLAAILSQPGAATVPEPVLAKVRRGAVLSSAEREVFGRIPEIGWRLLRNLPRLEEVAETVLYAQKNFNGTGYPVDGRAGEDLPLGSRILRAVYDFLSLQAHGESPRAALNTMFVRTAWYDLEVLRALSAEAEAMALQPPPPPVPCTLDELRAGQVLAGSIESEDGRVFIAAGTVLGLSHLEKVRNIARTLKLRQPVYVEGEPAS